jgi:hypothetical protein
MHYKRWLKHGDPLITKHRTGPQNHAWKGGRRIDRYGYVTVTHKGRSVGEHRLVMEGMLGRSLLPGETVHHVNGVRHDNRSENLELWSKSQPAGQRVEDKVAWAEELLALYKPEVLLDDRRLDRAILEAARGGDGAEGVWLAAGELLEPVSQCSPRAGSWK